MTYHLQRLFLPLVLGLAPPLFAQDGGARDSVVYRLAPESRLDVQTAKGGLLGFAGHDHLIRARSFSGRIVFFPYAPEASRIEIRVATGSLEVLTPPDTEEIRKVTEAMRTEVLLVDRHPEITLVSKTIDPPPGGGDAFRVVAALTIAGRTREVPLAVRTTIGPDTLRANATFAVKQTDFGIRPYRGGPAGTVRVADRVTFDIAVVAVRDDGP